MRAENPFIWSADLREPWHGRTNKPGEKRRCRAFRVAVAKTQAQPDSFDFSRPAQAFDITAMATSRSRWRSARSQTVLRRSHPVGVDDCLSEGLWRLLRHVTADATAHQAMLVLAGEELGIG